MSQILSYLELLEQSTAVAKEMELIDEVISGIVQSRERPLTEIEVLIYQAVKRCTFSTARVMRERAAQPQ